MNNENNKSYFDNLYGKKKKPVCVSARVGKINCKGHR